MKNKAEIFIEKYKYLEKIVTKKYGLSNYDSPIAYIEKLSEYASIRDQLKYCREVRNFLQHENKIDGEFVIIPSEKMIDLLNQVIIQIENPPLCSDVAIKIENIYHKKLDDYVLESMLAMKNRNFTHIPILDDNGSVIGVFSKSSVFSCLLDGEIGMIKSSLKFSDIRNYVSLNGYEQEIYRFASMNDTISKVSEMFENGNKRALRINMIFLTTNGKSTGKLQGILTAYDLLKY